MGIKSGKKSTKLQIALEKGMIPSRACRLQRRRGSAKQHFEGRKSLPIDYDGKNKDQPFQRIFESDLPLSP
ncbi:hypothetical protein CEXT_74191 [Caerostris extrusa]|uniref:Uncharacterized protein n=1 Tax=Caerostris extrusa TaxID=172846 RepID=A0AAV4UY27_CAEEX|nr:hypothetical protein CEXT_74191 [Caerostris extrusa]